MNGTERHASSNGCARRCGASGRLAALFDQLHDLTDVEEVVRRAAEHDVHFLPPGSVEGA